MPFNQLGTLAGSKFYNVEATYYYLRWWDVKLSKCPWKTLTCEPTVCQPCSFGYAEPCLSSFADFYCSVFWEILLTVRCSSSTYLSQYPIRCSLWWSLREPKAPVWQSSQDVSPSQEAGDKETFSISTKVTAFYPISENVRFCIKKKKATDIGTTL